MNTNGMMQREGNPHTVIMYALLVLLVIAMAFAFHQVTVVKKATDAGTWQCSNFACAKYIDTDEWVARNCAPSSASGDDTTMCTVPLDGVNTSIPLVAINLTYVGQQCEVASCIQEINVRTVNYTLPRP